MGAENLGSTSVNCGAGDGHAAGVVRQDARRGVSYCWTPLADPEAPWPKNAGT